MDGILKRHKMVKIEKKLKLYNALVKSVLLYNCCTWGMSTKDEKEMNSFHRSQKGRVLGVKYPTTMRNEAVYKRAKAKPLSVDITKARWKMLRHILRKNEKIRPD